MKQNFHNPSLLKVRIGRAAPEHDFAHFAQYKKSIAAAAAAAAHREYQRPLRCRRGFGRNGELKDVRRVKYEGRNGLANAIRARNGTFNTHLPYPKAGEREREQTNEIDIHARAHCSPGCINNFLFCSAEAAAEAAGAE